MNLKINANYKLPVFCGAKKFNHQSIKGLKAASAFGLCAAAGIGVNAAKNKVESVEELSGRTQVINSGLGVQESNNEILELLNDIANALNSGGYNHEGVIDDYDTVSSQKDITMPAIFQNGTLPAQVATMVYELKTYKGDDVINYILTKYGDTKDTKRAKVIADSALMKLSNEFKAFEKLSVEEQFDIIKEEINNYNKGLALAKLAGLKTPEDDDFKL